MGRVSQRVKQIFNLLGNRLVSHNHWSTIILNHAKLVRNLWIIEAFAQFLDTMTVAIGIAVVFAEIGLIKSRIMQICSSIFEQLTSNIRSNEVRPTWRVTTFRHKDNDFSRVRHLSFA